MMVDDLVLIKNENAAGVEYQRGRVEATFPGKDGHVRSAEIEYKNPSEKVFRTTVRPIQKLVVIVPVDYRHEDDERGSEIPGGQQVKGRSRNPAARHSRILFFKLNPTA